MFFIGIFGILNKEQDVTVLKTLPCHKCDGYYGANVIKSYRYFHIFFIPVYKWDVKYYGICKGCKSIYKISEEKGKMIEAGEDIVLNSNDIIIIKGQTKEGSNELDIKCLYCGEEISKNHIYCPQCGKKQ